MSLPPNLTASRFLCLFCAEAIVPTELDPCAVQVTAKFDRPREEQKEQMFYCHINCLRERSNISPGNFYICESDFPTIGDIDA